MKQPGIRWPVAAAAGMAICIALAGCDAGKGKTMRSTAINEQHAEQATGLTYNRLTPEEERVIVRKGTEQAFTGKYENFFEEGVYTCRRCGAGLFSSEAKFKSGCGWPSYDESIAGAVERRRDADGSRTEILCARCGAHLGHVFEGEGKTAKDTRHCVNSVSIDFVPAERIQRAVFAAGCFWGVEHYMKNAPGVITATVGYTGGHTQNPTYRQVCGGDTGHLEAVEVVFDGGKTTYEEVAKLFFEIHDPTQADGQGPDRGEQYKSAIFYEDEGQRKIVERLAGELRGKGMNVATEIRAAGKFWAAEEYHQDYYRKNGKEPYCHARVKRF
jgi:peptide methionine sulfoxide reductase msrA/msrB